jgi:hypothetical protein
MNAASRFALHANGTYIEDKNGNKEFKIYGSVKSAFIEQRQFNNFYVNPTGYVEIQFYTNNGIITYVKKINTFPRFEKRHKSTPVSVAVPFELKIEGDNILPDDMMNVQLVVKFDHTQSSNIVNITRGLSLNREFQLKKEELFQKDILKKDYEFQRIQNQEITFNEQQNSGDFNETPITEINLNNSCSECTGTKFIDPIPEKQLTENYLKIGGIAAVGVGILLLYTRRNKK